MRLPVRNARLGDKYPSIWETIASIARTLNWSENEILDALLLTQQQVMRMKARRIAPSIFNIDHLAEVVGLSAESIVSGIIDYSVLQLRTRGNIFALPERFHNAAFSKRRTSINLIEYLNRRFGAAAKDQILTHFQLTDAIFSKPDETINFLFPTELCLYLQKSGYGSSALFHEMGAFSLQTNKKTPFGVFMSGLGSPRRLIERVFTDVAAIGYDRNCDYQIIGLTSERCLVRARVSELLKDGLKNNKPGNTGTCAVRGGTFASLAGYLNAPLSIVKEVSCIHRGDSSCVYEIDFTNAQLESTQTYSSSSLVH